MPDPAPLAEIRLPGEGLVLRPWRVQDMRALQRHANDAEVARGLSSRFPHPYRRMDAVRFLSGEVVDLRDPVFAIEVDGQACGGIGARPQAGERSGVAELGYWLGRRHWGQGLMTRVVGLYAPWVIEHLQLRRLEAMVLDSNPASAAVLAKCGFQEEGTLRHVIQREGVPRNLRLFARLQAPPGP